MIVAGAIASGMATDRIVAGHPIRLVMLLTAGLSEPGPNTHQSETYARMKSFLLAAAMTMVRAVPATGRATSGSGVHKLKGWYVYCFCS
jgi:hypothetical protein